ncbi:Ppx/GppA phosphatase family protein [Streptomyces sp. ACA25]|uniref:Ppx/GppA phosphatase family protein n=1 Tax=Streptomyces sp. ACA25 TaxID=3022596 RepID=UPI002307695E|nr:Ppx/GppA phosphatase family protein [Streptomyces sp. ACA25]MDB1087209.1 Ppx/GppA phosphatase family protein [Streptomyces sp. ACA25]
MTRVAAVDCGTNSIRLLVADLDPASGRLTDLERRMEIVRLGQGVDRTGRLDPLALERTLTVCRTYAEMISGYGIPPGRVRFVATSASRDAENRADFVRGVREILAVTPEVISGDEEARLSFTGATRELAGQAGIAAPYLVLDIGGGSTEFVLGASRVTAAGSVDIGCVRLTERHLLRDGRISDPPSPGEIAAMTADIGTAIEAAGRSVPVTGARTLIGLAGSVTTVAGIALGLGHYDSAAIHHSRLGIDQVQEVTQRLLTSTHAERAAIPVMHPGRVDVIAAGALVLRTVMERTGIGEVLVSEHDILDGIAWSAVPETS